MKLLTDEALAAAFHAHRTNLRLACRDDLVVAYVSLAAHLVVRAEIPRMIARGAPTPFRRCCSPDWPSTGPCTGKGSVASCC
jgi:hypothetical protein